MRAVARRSHGYVQEVEIEGGHRMLVDEPVDAGGENAGPSPTRLVAAGLASCIAITMEMYAQRKGGELGDTEVGVEATYEDFVPTAFTAEVRLADGLSEEQRSRLLAVARKCPVHRILAGETDVTISERSEPLGPPQGEAA
jgi:putative redox protein